MRKTKYQPLANYLLASNKNDLMLTFSQIEEILGFDLPASSRKHRANWSNNEVEALSWGWRNAGYESYAVDMTNEIAHFRKVRGIDNIIIKDERPKATMFFSKKSIEKVNLSERVDKFTNIYHSDDNSRYLSYDHIRHAFLELRNDPNKRDLLALNLYAYLASWGKLRNSFLMQKD